MKPEPAVLPPSTSAESSVATPATWFIRSLVATLMCYGPVGNETGIDHWHGKIHITHYTLGCDQEPYDVVTFYVKVRNAPVPWVITDLGISSQLPVCDHPPTGTTTPTRICHSRCTNILFQMHKKIISSRTTSVACRANTSDFPRGNSRLTPS